MNYKGFFKQLGGIFDTAYKKRRRPKPTPHFERRYTIPSALRCSEHFAARIDRPCSYHFPGSRRGRARCECLHPYPSWRKCENQRAVGDHFSRADLTVASLLAGFARPNELAVRHTMFGSDSLAADVERWSKRAIMRWVRSQYEMYKSLLSLPKRTGQASSPLSEPALGMSTGGQKLT